MFAADAQLDVRATRPSAFCRQRHQLADAVDIETDEGIARKETLIVENPC